MKKVLVVFCVLGIFANIAFAEGLLDGKNISVNGDFAFNSSYLFRGVKAESGSVMQADLYVQSRGLTVGVWKSQASKAEKVSNAEEIDYTIGYAKTIGKITGGVGFTYYDYPAIEASSEREFNVTLALDAPLAPRVLMANNYTNDILYYELGLSHSVEVSKYISANFGLITAFYNRNEIKGLSYYDASLGFGMKLSDKLSMTPNIHFMATQGDFKDAKKGNHDDELYGGVTLSYSI